VQVCIVTVGLLILGDVISSAVLIFLCMSLRKKNIPQLIIGKSSVFPFLHIPEIGLKLSPNSNAIIF